MSFINNNWWLLPLIVTIFSGILCPAMGTVLITHKRLLQVNLISHCVLPGLALAYAFGVNPSIGGVVSGLLGSLVAESLTNRKNENYEAVMNTILAGMLGLGVILIPLLGIRIDLETVLFGDLFVANFEDLLETIIAFLVFMLLMAFGYEKIVYVGLDPEGASASGINVSFLNFALSFTTALVIVSSMSAVGVILVIALLSTPTLLGLNKAQSLRIAMIRSSFYGLCISLLGFILSIIFNLSPGPAISVICVASLLIPKLRK
jgi:zinc/manganese transport system permease protein